MKKVFTQSLFTIAAMLVAAASYAQPANDLPCNAIAIVLDAPANMYNNLDATNDAGEVAPTVANCQTGWCELDLDSTIWFTFVAPANGAVVVNSCLDNSTVDLQVAVYSVGDCGDYATYTLVGANDDTPGGCAAPGAANFSSTLALDALTPGATYFLQTDGYNGAVGDYYIEVTTGIPTAKVKIVHNSADLGIATIDIRVNGDLVVDNLAYQSHTNFLDVLAQEEITVTVHDAGSVDASNPLYTTTLELDPIGQYIMIGSGIISASGYSPATPFSLHIFDQAVLVNPTLDQFSVLVYHGSTDAPATIDVENMDDGTTYFNDVTYGNYYSNAYVNLPSGLYSLDITDASGTPLGLAYCANLEFAPQTIIILASGFVDPAANSNGAAFGLFSLNNNFGGTFMPLSPGGCIAPPNDLPCNAATLVVNDAPTAGTNMFATAEPDEAHPAGTACQDSIGWCAFDSLATISVWYKFVATNTVATVSTCLAGTSLDSQVAVYSVGNCSDYSTYTLLGANDDTPGGCTAANTTFASFLNLEDLTIGNTYYVQVDGYGGSDNPFNIQVTAPVGVNEVANNKPIALYPNPVSEILTVKYAGYAPYIIYDSKGAIVQQSLMNGMVNIDVRDMAAGIYTLMISEGGNSQSVRFVVE